MIVSACHTLPLDKTFSNYEKPALIKALGESTLSIPVDHSFSSFSTTENTDVWLTVVPTPDSHTALYTAVDMILPKSFSGLCTVHVQVVHQPLKCTVHESWKQCLYRWSIQEVSKSCKKCQECVQECVT